jgi:protein-tyrosine phosphatase
MALSSAPNFRHFGGGPTVNGRTVRTGLLYRSEAVLDPVGDDEGELRRAGIALICDLRSSAERYHAPNSWWEAQGIGRLDLNILADIRNSEAIWSTLRAHPSRVTARAIMLSIYEQFPRAALQHLGTIAGHIADGRLPLPIHCTAGKDRTGFICAMLLKALNVEHAYIVADYLRSSGQATARVADHTRRLIEQKAGPDIPEAAIEAIIGVEADYLNASMGSIEVEYGTISKHLQAAGIDGALKGRMEKRLLL